MLFRKPNSMRAAGAALGILLAWGVVCSPSAFGQSQQQSGQQGQGQQPASPVATPPQTVTGVFAPHVEPAGEIRSSLGFGFHADEYVDSNVEGLSGTSSWLATTDIGGEFDLRRARERSDLVLTMSGGGLLYPTDSQFNSGYAAVGVTDTIGFRRGSLVFTDLFSYLPDSPLGFGAGGMDGIPGNPLSSYGLLNPSASPDQSILNLQTERLSNEAIVQGEWSSSARSSWTFTGGYGILHYTNSVFVQPSNINAGVGYNHSLSPGNIIGISEAASFYRFSPNIYSMNDNIVYATYGRVISRKLFFKVGAGPEIDSFTVQSGSTPGTRVSYSVNLGLSYLVNRTELQVSGYRYVSGGSGILFGALTTGVQASISHPFGRHWLVNGNAGYNVNQALSQTSTASSSYDSIFVTGGISRSIGRNANFFVRYNVVRQIASGATCVSTICLATFNRQEGFVGFSWNTRPFGID